MTTPDPIDLESVPPLPQPDEAYCTACLRIAKKKDRAGWVYFGFKRLAAQDICGDCLPKWAEHFQALQRQGL